MWGQQVTALVFDAYFSESMMNSQVYIAETLVLKLML